MMPEWSKIMAHIQARSLRSVFTDLAKLRLKSPASDQPQVTIYLAGGQQLTGTVAAFDQGHQQSILVLYTAYRNPVRHQVHYLDAAYITGISLEDASALPELSGLITGGKVTPETAFEPVGRLGFQRFLRDTAGAFSEFKVEASDTLFASTDDFGFIQVQCERLFAVLISLLNEAIGREAITQKVTTIVIDSGTQFKAVLEQGTLRVYLLPDEATGALPGEEAIRKAVEAVL